MAIGKYKMKRNNEDSTLSLLKATTSIIAIEDECG